jgi:hypothetical protein
MYFAISCIIYQVVYWVKKGNKNNLKEKQCRNNIELLFMKKHLTFSSFSLGAWRLMNVSTADGSAENREILFM